MQVGHYCGRLFCCVVGDFVFGVYSSGNETETTPSGIISAKNTEGKKTPPENGQCSFKITLRSQNATVMRTNFHGLAIDSTLVRLDLDKLLCSVHFDTKLQQNGKLFFHD